MTGLMQIRRSTAIIALVAASVGGGLIAAFASKGGGTAPVFVTAEAANQAEALPQSMTFAPVLKRAAPAVVQISSTKVIKAETQGRGRRAPQGQNPFEDDPFFRRFFGDNNPFFGQPRDRRESGLGSGVIVSPQGYILTNSHVVEGATNVKVTLSDRREFTAKIVGTDPQTDIAVIKIDNKDDLPVLPLSDSSKTQVGDIVLAIGNPFGIGQTVTLGIVSATGRNLGGAIEVYEDFIQTDAAINPGNSGGALINPRGELIGINTAILSGSGANAGVGFAVPINLARNIMDQLMKTGKVTRGYLGAYLDDVDPPAARAFGLPAGTTGVALTQVDEGSPAARGGLRVGDVVVALNGENVSDMQQLRLRVASMQPGTAAKLRIYRDGKPQEVTVTLGERPSDEQLARGRRGGAPGPGDDGQASGLTGVSVDELRPEVAQQLGLERGTTGVVVTEVDQSSPAADAGLQRGDVIMQVNRQAVRSVSDFDRLVRSSQGTALLLVNRGGRRAFIAVESR